MTIKNFDGCVAKLRSFRDSLLAQLQITRDFYEQLPSSLQAKWDKAAEFGGAILANAPTDGLLKMHEAGTEAIGKLDATVDAQVKFATIVAFQIVLSELGPRLDAAIAAASTAGDQIETEASALDEERPDFDEGSDSDYDRAVSEGFVASQTASA